MTEKMRLEFTRLPISLPCPVPVLPGTPTTMRDGEPIPMAERTERCAVDAFWMLGAQVLCDVHLKEACALLEISYDEMLDEAAGSEAYDYPAAVIADHWRVREAIPWAERRRYPQEEANRVQEMPPA